jgi:uncharacterized protein YacL
MNLFSAAALIGLVIALLVGAVWVFRSDATRWVKIASIVVLVAIALLASTIILSATGIRVPDPFQGQMIDLPHADRRSPVEATAPVLKGVDIKPNFADVADEHQERLRRFESE